MTTQWYAAGLRPQETGPRARRGEGRASVGRIWARREAAEELGINGEPRPRFGDDPLFGDRDEDARRAQSPGRVVLAANQGMITVWVRGPTTFVTKRA